LLPHVDKATQRAFKERYRAHREAHRDSKKKGSRASKKGGSKIHTPAQIAKARVLFDFVPSAMSGSASLSESDVVEIIEREAGDLCRVRIGTRTATVPASYLRELPMKDARTVVAMFDFVSDKDGHLPFRCDETITAFEEQKGWMRGFIGTRFGRFPSNYVREQTFDEKNEEELMQAADHEERGDDANEDDFDDDGDDVDVDTAIFRPADDERKPAATAATGTAGSKHKSVPMSTSALKRSGAAAVGGGGGGGGMPASDATSSDGDTTKPPPLPAVPAVVATPAAPSESTTAQIAAAVMASTNALVDALNAALESDEPVVSSKLPPPLLAKVNLVRESAAEVRRRAGELHERDAELKNVAASHDAASAQQRLRVQVRGDMRFKCALTPRTLTQALEHRAKQLDERASNVERREIAVSQRESDVERREAALPAREAETVSASRLSVRASMSSAPPPPPPPPTDEPDDLFRRPSLPPPLQDDAPTRAAAAPADADAQPPLAADITSVEARVIWQAAAVLYSAPLAALRASKPTADASSVSALCDALLRAASAESREGVGQIASTSAALLPVAAACAVARDNETVLGAARSIAQSSIALIVSSERIAVSESDADAQKACASALARLVEHVGTLQRQCGAGALPPSTSALATSLNLRAERARRASNVGMLQQATAVAAAAAAATSPLCTVATATAATGGADDDEYSQCRSSECGRLFGNLSRAYCDRD
jgi:hypothetical protein